MRDKNINKKKKKGTSKASVSPSKKGRTIRLSGSSNGESEVKAKLHVAKKASPKEIRKTLKIKVKDEVVVRGVINVLVKKKSD